METGPCSPDDFVGYLEESVLSKPVYLLVAFTLAGCEFVPQRSSGHNAARPSDEEVVHQGIDFLLPEVAYKTPLPALRWSEHDKASLYELAVDDSEQCSSPLQTYRVKSPARTLTHLDNGVYFACLRALDDQGKELAHATGEFRVKADSVADPREQNANGGSGAPLTTVGLGPFPLYLGEQMGTPSAFGAFADPHDDDHLKLFVNDRTHRRVLVYDRVPLSEADQPVLAIGQPSLTATGSNGSARGISAKGFGDNVHVSVCPSGKVLVTDRGNHRVLVYNSIPRTNGARADLVIGQTDLTQHLAGVGPGSLKQPGAAYCMEDRLVILDRGNNRILVFNSFPTKSGAKADYVVGQDDLTTTTPGCGANGLNSPSAALLADGRFYVADSGNNRIVAFSGLPKATGAKADLVLGQKTLARCRANGGGRVSAGGLDAPSAVAFRDGVLAVGDPGNHRVVFYFSPLKSGKEAEHVLGQPTFDRNAATSEGQLNEVASAKALLFDGNYLWVADQASRSVSVLPLPY